MGTLFLRSFDLLLHSRTIPKRGNNTAGSLPQKGDTTYLCCRRCLHDKSKQPRMSFLGFAFSHCGEYCQAWKADGKCVVFNLNL